MTIASNQQKYEKLKVIIPVYNESGIIEHVVASWMSTLEQLSVDFEICCYNDESKDDTGSILDRMVSRYPRLKVIHKKNSGHGPTILRGYGEALLETDWIFQVDSDNEMSSDFFPQLWNLREQFDFLVGARHQRNSPLVRRVITMVSRLTVVVFYGQGRIFDVNSPYRLMRSQAVAPIISQIPSHTFAPNVTIVGGAHLFRLRCLEIEVPFRDRQTGVSSIKKWKLLSAAAKSFWQTVANRFVLKRGNAFRNESYCLAAKNPNE